MSVVCERLKEERIRLELSQQALTGVLAVSMSSVKRWEKDTPIPSDKLGMLYQFGFDVLYITTGHHLPEPGHVREDPAIYGMTESQKAAYGMNMILEAQEELGLMWTKEQMKILMGYAYEHAPTKESLLAFVNAALAVSDTD